MDLAHKQTTGTETERIRNRIIQVFLEREGAYVSGNELARVTGVSRTAVWKHIKALEALGFAFESATRLGYRVTDVPDLLLKPILDTERKSHEIGREVIWHREVDSTNVQASAWAQAGAPHGTVVTAMQQTGGRGRRGKAWFSPPEGLWFSVIFRRTIPIRHAAELTLLTSVAVRRAVVKHTGLPIRIKWPNDLLCEGRKVCGILAEIRADGENLQHAIVGVGINTNIEAAKFPSELSPHVTSLLRESGTAVSHVLLCSDIFVEMEQLFDLLVTEGTAFQQVVEEWRRESATLGNRVRVQAPQGLVEGTAVDIDDAGVLLVQRDDGEVVAIYSGDVLF